jgi:hypothetical protein
MSETPTNNETSENSSRPPLGRALPNLVVAAITAMISPFLLCLLMLPILVVLAWLSENELPTTLKNLIDGAGALSFMGLYFGSGLVLCIGVQFVILGIPALILGWRFGLITQLSSIGTGFVIGCLPWALLITFGTLASFGSMYPSFNKEILGGIGAIIFMGFLGAFEGFIFWRVWQFLAQRSVPT